MVVMMDNVHDDIYFPVNVDEVIRNDSFRCVMVGFDAFEGIVKVAGKRSW